MAGLANADQADAVRKSTNIGAQGLGPALQLFAKERDIQVVYRSEFVADRRTGGAAGELTVDETLTQLLSGTGMTYQNLADDGITIVPVAGASAASASSLSSPNLPKKSRSNRFRLAQSETSVAKDPALEEVIVSARKRQESVQDVPAAIYVLPETTLKSFGVTDLIAASKLTPGLLLTRAPNNAAANIYLRGVGSSFVNASFDQAVVVNIDNVPISKGRAIYQSFFDMQQMETLKGPQALFFGKNSTAGVISIKTADPSEEIEVIARGSHEFNGETFAGELIASGPLTDTLGVRVALNGSTMNGGFFKNNAYELTGVRRDSDTPKEDQYGGRITFLYEPNDAFDINAKISLDKMENDGINGFAQLINCQGSGGTPQPAFGFAPNTTDCRLNDRQSSPALDPTLAAEFPYSNGGEPFSDYDGLLASATANYNFGVFTLTSVTGYYEYDSAYFDNINLGAAMQTYANERVEYSSFTQELRLSTAFHGPLNVTTGMFYDDVILDYARAVRLFAHPADPVTGRVDSWDAGGRTDGNTYSVFVELVWDITPNLELSGGARYSREEKDTVLRSLFANPSSGLLFINEPIFDKFKDDNVSPAMTLRWRPLDGLTLFASFKEGYKSGGSNVSEIPFLGTTSDGIHFNSEKAKGGEFGAKVELLDGSLWLGATIYDYSFEDLQVSSWDPAALAMQVGNAGKYDVRGVEVDASWIVPSVDGLRLQGSLYYNRAEYANYLGPCYTGQSIAAGCNQLMNPVTGAYTSQDMDGRPGAHAPEWTSIFGATYDLALPGGDLWAGLSLQVRYSSDYYLQETLSPLQRQDEFVDVSASIRFYMPSNDSWEFAVIGRNLTNELIGANDIDLVGTGSGTGTESAIPADTHRMLNRPREIMAQLTYRF